MSTFSPRFASAFLRYASPLAGLRRVPVLGGLLRRTSRKLVAQDTLLWVQIEFGPAEGKACGSASIRGLAETYCTAPKKNKYKTPSLAISAPAWSFMILVPISACFP